MARRRSHVAVLLILDGGLRSGEAAAFRWEDLVWGSDENDLSRSLNVLRSYSRGVREDEGTKSGSPRTVPMSRRLRRALREHYARCGRPLEATEVLGIKFDARNFQDRALGPLSERVLGSRRTTRHLRQTFASSLESQGVPRLLIQMLLGHSEGGDTAGKHYVSFVGGFSAPGLDEGAVVTDLIASASDGSALSGESAVGNGRC